jgi:aminopeptidase N
MNRFFITLLLMTSSVFAQNQQEEMSLLATPNQERTCYDIHSYEIDLNINPEKQNLVGRVDFHFEILQSTNRLQFDLDDVLVIDSILFENNTIKNIQRKHRSVSFNTLRTLEKGENLSFSVYYQGSPQKAVNPPWDGGMSWRKDKNGKHWIGVSCEGDGASIWWPNKDLLNDEPDSVVFSCTYPDDLLFVSNGNMMDDKLLGNNLRKTTWKTHHPINNYNITLNIGDYTHIKDTFFRENGSQLPLDYYVLSYNKEKAVKQFKIVHPMLKSFEKHFGEYPFPKDAYALVETPYLGMEHQSAIAYGNQYKKGYLGRYPKKMDFDFIVIHETGHEWWGNSVSMKDRSDMWIHESFCTYSEALFVEDYYGYESMKDYLVYQKKFIQNTSPIQGVPHHHESGHGGDIYYKGSWILHTLRNIVDNDSLWKKTIYNLAQQFKHKTVDGVDVKAFLEKELNLNLDTFFKVYFDSTHYPTVEIKKEKKHILIRLDDQLNLPIHLKLSTKKGKTKTYTIGNTWVKIKKASLKEITKEINRNYLVKIKNL